MQEIMIEVNKYIDEIFTPSIQLFEGTIRVIEKKIGKPYFEDNHGIQKWKFDKPRREHISLLRGVRIVSGFNACCELLKKGYVQEIAVLLRTIIEFQQDIVFLMDGFPDNELTKQQKVFIDECLKATYINHHIPFKGTPKREMISRKKIIAVFTRSFSEYVNPTDLQKNISIPSDVYSGYVHGSFDSIMEMYGGMPPSSKYHMTGLLGTPRIFLYSKNIVSYIHLTFNILAIMCNKLLLVNQYSLLIERRKQFEIDTKEFGFKYNLNLKRALRNLKQGKPLND